VIKNFCTSPGKNKGSGITVGVRPQSTLRRKEPERRSGLDRPLVDGGACRTGVRPELITR
jgi:hypothetical protein